MFGGSLLELKERQGLERKGRGASDNPADSLMSGVLVVVVEVPRTLKSIR